MKFKNSCIDLISSFLPSIFHHLCKNVCLHSMWQMCLCTSKCVTLFICPFHISRGSLRYWGSHSLRDEKRQKGAKTEWWDTHETGFTEGGKGKTLKKKSKKWSRKRKTQETKVFSNQLAYFLYFAPFLVFLSASLILTLFTSNHSHSCCGFPTVLHLRSFLRNR